MRCLATKAAFLVNIEIIYAAGFSIKTEYYCICTLYKKTLRDRISIFLI